MNKYLEEASKSLNIELPALNKAAASAEIFISRFRQELHQTLSESFPPEEYDLDVNRADVVLLGSLAREESTKGSDCDYFVLQNGASPSTTKALIFAAEKVREALGFKQPGVQGFFGKIVIAANLYESIGLEIDSNVNMTQRLLFLTESKSLLNEMTHQSVFDNTLSRYCADYLSRIREKSSIVKVPRFLLNDLVRFWRTMAVDFGTKRWRTMKDDSHLRLAKLRITRKILFAGPLATLMMVPTRVKDHADIKDYLRSNLSIPPIAQLASTMTGLNENSRNAMRTLLLDYDAFIALLDNGDFREVMQGPRQKDDPSFLEAQKRCKYLGDNIQSSLETIFIDDDLFRANFRKYGLF